MITVKRSKLLNVNDLRVHYPITGGIFFPKETGRVRAVDGISFDISPGETFSLVGESGSGKSTVAKSIVGLLENMYGDIVFDGTNINTCSSNELRNIRRKIGFVFQDPYGSLNPRMRVGDIIGEPLKVHKLYREDEDFRTKINDLLNIVGLNPNFAERFPHEFSGGQRQRISIARAIATNPDLVILDEPVSALDVSIQAQVLNLLIDLQNKFNVAFLFISHDLSVVRHISDRVGVMYMGKIIELGKTDEIFFNPYHPYTKALLSAIPEPDPDVELKRERIILSGELPGYLNPPSGCHFHPRCPISTTDCSKLRPKIKNIHKSNHFVACIKVEGY
jgi:oligopeptide transport system ATP-binding protein